MREVRGAVRRSRADGRRNRQLILDVAESVFHDEGVTGSINEIAKRAGVGAGTLYRHFPTRDDLLAALLEDRDRELSARGDAIYAGGLGSDVALQEWLDSVTHWSSAFRGLSDPLRHALADRNSPLTLTCEGFVTITDALLGEAQRTGAARRDVRGRDLFLAALAIAWISDAAMADDSTAHALRQLTRTGWLTRSTGPG